QRPWSWWMNAAIRSHIATGLAYIGQCPLCGISASSTPLAASFARYDSVEFSSPYMNMRGQGSARNFGIRSSWSERSTIDRKIPRTAPGRTLSRRLTANRALEEEERRALWTKSSRKPWSSSEGCVRICRLKKQILTHPSDDDNGFLDDFVQ